MTDDHLVFTKDEWERAVPQVTKDMHEYAFSYSTSIARHMDDEGGAYGEAWGTGSYLRLGDRTFILTNEHVAKTRSDAQLLIHHLAGEEQLQPIHGDHFECPWPFDVALLPVAEEVWDDRPKTVNAITIDQIAFAHAPANTEIFTFAGYSGERGDFMFDTLIARGTSSTSREIILPQDERFNARFHIGLDYKPDLAHNVVGEYGLPLPPGFSGSTVWNTRFVESRIAGVSWTPEQAVVTGVIWGWPSEASCLVATRVEYVRSFLLDVLSGIQGAER